MSRKKKRDDSDGCLNIAIYALAGGGFGIFIGLISSVILSLYGSWWIDRNIPWENQDVGDFAVIIGSIISTTVFCGIVGLFIGIFAGIVSLDGKNNQNR